MPQHSEAAEGFGTLFGYARVSTEDQNHALQVEALKRAGCSKVFTEKAQGTDPRRPALARCLKALQPGDTLIVWKLDRLGRSVRNVLNILHDLDAQGVQFKSLTEAIDTSTPIGRAMVHMAALLAELERGLIVERTRAGVKVAQARGVKFGRKPKLTTAQIQHAAEQLESNSRSVADMAQLYNVSRVTLWRAIKDMGEVEA